MRRLSAIVLVLALLSGEPGPRRSGIAPSIEVWGRPGGSRTACAGSGPAVPFEHANGLPGPPRVPRDSPLPPGSDRLCRPWSVARWGCRVAGQQGWHAPPPPPPRSPPHSPHFSLAVGAPQPQPLCISMLLFCLTRTAPRAVFRRPCAGQEGPRPALRQQAGHRLLRLRLGCWWQGLRCRRQH